MAVSLSGFLPLLRMAMTAVGIWATWLLSPTPSMPCEASPQTPLPCTLVKQPGQRRSAYRMFIIVQCSLLSCVICIVFWWSYFMLYLMIDFIRHRLLHLLSGSSSPMDCWTSTTRRTMPYWFVMYVWMLRLPDCLVLGRWKATRQHIWGWQWRRKRYIHRPGLLNGHQQLQHRLCKPWDARVQFRRGWGQWPRIWCSQII